MSVTEYGLHLQVANTAAELHQLSRLAATDSELTEKQRQQVADAIGKRFAQLNAAALPVKPGRW